MNTPDKTEALKKIQDTISQCDQCRAVPGTGDIPVFPRGNPSALCMLVGEGPGEQEERQQKPLSVPQESSLKTR